MFARCASSLVMAADATTRGAPAGAPAATPSLRDLGVERTRTRCAWSSPRAPSARVPNSAHGTVTFASWASPSVSPNAACISDATRGASPEGDAPSPSIVAFSAGGVITLGAMRSKLREGEAYTQTSNGSFGCSALGTHIDRWLFAAHACGKKSPYAMKPRRPRYARKNHCVTFIARSNTRNPSPKTHPSILPNMANRAPALRGASGSEGAVR